MIQVIIFLSVIQRVAADLLGIFFVDRVDPKRIVIEVINMRVAPLDAVGFDNARNLIIGDFLIAARSNLSIGGISRRLSIIFGRTEGVLYAANSRYSR